MSDTHQVDASLGLMLDMICDTFGGVLFIAMLVVVMTNASAHQEALSPPSDEAQSLLKGLTEEMQATVAELNTLRRALQTQQEIEDEIAPETLRELAGQVAALRRQWTDDTQARNEALAGTGATQQEVNQAVQEIQKRDHKLAQARADLEAAQQRLQAELALRSRTARLPRQRVTQKKPAVLFLRGGRLVQLARRQHDGSVDNQTSDCIISTADGVTSLEPKPGVGLSVDTRGAGNDEIAGRLSQFDNSRYFLLICVWPDSFEEFIFLREIMVRLQFEYNLVRLQSIDDRVRVGGPSGGPDVVQ